MAALVWDNTGERLYETGVSNGVLYKKDASGNYVEGVAWNGLISVAENPSGAEATHLYADNIKYLDLISAEQLGATITAYMSPEEFDEYDGCADLADGVSIKQQTRKTFGLAYKSIVGNDIDGDAHGYKLHLLYGCVATPSEKTFQTVNESPEAINLSWTINTTPVNVTGHKPTSAVVIDSTKADATKLAALEAILFGGESTEPRMPLPDEIATIFAQG